MEQLVKLLSRSPCDLETLAKRLKKTQKTIREQLADLRLQGYLIEKHGTKWSLSKAIRQKEKKVDDHPFVSDSDNTYTFGFIGDTHLGSKYERLDVLNTLYDVFQIEGITKVFHQGNWVDGECRLNRHDIHTHGIDSQCDYLIKNYPQRDGITTYAITGDDHEGWWAKDNGIDVGMVLENKMRNAGREDWVNTGYMEAYIPLVNANTRKRKYLLSMHPGGGSAYAISYRPQKIVEAFGGGDKPSVLLIGHYHKMSYNLIRGVHTIQSGCTQDQGVFMRKKGLEAHVGGGICKLSQDPKSGAIYRCRVDFLQFFNKGYYNNRWGYSGPVTLPERGVS